VRSILPDWGWRSWPAIGSYLTEQRPDILHIQYQAAAFDLGGWINWLPWYLKKRQYPGKVVTTFHDLGQRDGCRSDGGKAETAHSAARDVVSTGPQPGLNVGAERVHVFPL
jgi:hypothetical protein